MQPLAAALGVAARDRASLTICDLTQSYSPAGGGGISTYLREKRDYVLNHTPHQLLQIVPGPEDRVTVNGRHIFAEVGAEPVRGSPNYRFILRTDAVRDLLEHYRPDIIESLCPWVLPWTAINHRRDFPATTLVAGYRTDFPNAHVHRVVEAKAGNLAARFMRMLAYGYAEITYREFDRVYTLSEDARRTLARKAITRTDVMPLGVDTTMFAPSKRDPGYRAALGIPGDGPLLIYAGRIDNEKRADRLVDMFRKLPRDLGAGLVLMGDGKLRERLMHEAQGLPIAFPAYYPNAERLILEQDGAPIGRLYVDAWPLEFRIVDISLLPVARSQGLGEAILRDMIAWAQDQAKGVSIHVEKFNPARRLYLRLGFVVTEDKGVYELMEFGTPGAAKALA
ncbi:GNAT family N-acetyltransferase [Sphingomonas koreensis]|uniref:GNAT family N-acetyltransferase n=1 Tax=Sphingomonas koreensis TaxID=93064 RepID=UPI001F495391|nr:GNAT family N-acetyltransferase [Sphingomonas koreensis]